MTPARIKREIDRAYEGYGATVEVRRFVSAGPINDFGEGGGSYEETFEVKGLVSTDKDERKSHGAQLQRTLDYDAMVSIRESELVEKSASISSFDGLRTTDVLVFNGSDWRIVAIERTGQVADVVNIFKVWVKNQLDGYPT